MQPGQREGTGLLLFQFAPGQWPQVTPMAPFQLKPNASKQVRTRDKLIQWTDFLSCLGVCQPLSKLNKNVTLQPTLT